MKKISFTTFCLITFSVVYFGWSGIGGCHNPTPEDTSFSIQINPYPPKDLDTGASPKQLAEFAWEEFLALNWKASYNQNGVRDMPDTSWNYFTETNAYPDLNVWETYAHRSELRPWNNVMPSFNTAPHYSYDTSIVKRDTGTNFTLFDNLDENSEIGSCNLFAYADKYQRQYQVLYQAKVNRDEYNYIMKHFPDSTALYNATVITAKNIDRLHMYYSGGGTNTCNGPDSVICLPCGNTQNPDNHEIYTGAIEVKSAWRELVPGLDDTSKFLKRTVIYYTKDTVSRSHKIFSHNKVYGLIALHIIHKTKNYPAFVFATFEQEDVMNAGMKYLLQNGKNGYDSTTFYSPYRRQAISALTKASTDYVHKKLPKSSIWQHYHLVGVQGIPTNDSTSDSTDFFLANYAVESDTLLSDFHGSGFSNPHNHDSNLLYNGHFYSMGGCQGCHGVAQKTFGTDFSFLLDAGNGKPTKVPDTSGAPKLVKYITTLILAEKRLKK